MPPRTLLARTAAEGPVLSKAWSGRKTNIQMCGRELTCVNRLDLIRGPRRNSHGPPFLLIGLAIRLRVTSMLHIVGCLLTIGSTHPYGLEAFAQKGALINCRHLNVMTLLIPRTTWTPRGQQILQHASIRSETRASMILIRELRTGRKALCPIVVI